MKKIAIISSHPIQYYAPLFRELSKLFNLKVFYCHQPNAVEIGKDGFGKAFKWDIDLLAGYEFEFLKNHSRQASLSNFYGCDTPQIGEKIAQYGATHVVVFGWYLKSFIQALNYCNKNSLPIAVRGDSQLDPNLPFYKKAIKRITYPFFLRKYTAFLYVGSRNRKYLKHFGVSDKKLIFSPHAVDQNFWKAKKELKVHDKFVFVWVGKMIDKKRPLDVIHAFKEAFGENKKVELCMVGAGELMEKAKKQSTSIIRFLGFKNQTELVDIINESHCLILSSDYRETWGLVVNEAMSCGLPCIVSDACGCSEDMIEDNKTGMVFKFGSVSQLKEKMVLMQKDYNKVYSKVAIKNKNEKYSYKSNAESFKIFVENY